MKKHFSAKKTKILICKKRTDENTWAETVITILIYFPSKFSSAAWTCNIWIPLFKTFYVTLVTYFFNDISQEFWLRYPITVFMDASWQCLFLITIFQNSLGFSKFVFVLIWLASENVLSSDAIDWRNRKSGH